jgi:lysozyme family protein
MVDIEKLKSLNTARWLKAKISVGQGAQFLTVAQRLVNAKKRYQLVSANTGVPWWFIAVVHERESGQDWSRSLAQGDPWDQVSTHVPAGRGPFGSWEDAADDALTNCAPFPARNHDWSVGGSLTMLEQYNGLGYATRGIPSPYVWSGTDQYTSGKYIRDGVFDPNVVDRQLGCAGLLLAMKSIDPSVLVVGNQPQVELPSSPSTQVAANTSWLSSLLSIFTRRS